MIEKGRVVMKTAGREAGRYAVIVERVDDKFVLITGPKAVTGIKRRKCNIEHIKPTENAFDIGSSANDSQIEAAWKDSGLIEKLEIEVPKQRTKQPKEAKAASGKGKQSKA